MSNHQESLEIEIRFKIDPKKENIFIAKLANKNCILSDPVFQDDAYFHSSNETSDTRSHVLRIRTTQNNSELAYKTFKGAQSDAWLEKEVAVSNSTQTRLILDAIGYKEFLSIKKYRRSGKINEVTINIDEVENLGTFCEMEIIGPDTKTAQATMISLAKELGLSEKQITTTGYVQLMEAHVKKH